MLVTKKYNYSKVIVQKYNYVIFDHIQLKINAII